ncbi:MAG: hypothetical protein QM802_04815 [Agriterribacter sp.]
MHKLPHQAQRPAPMRTGLVYDRSEDKIYDFNYIQVKGNEAASSLFEFAANNLH